MIHLVRALVLFGFAALIAKLLLGGQMVKYLSPSLDPLSAATGIVMIVMGVLELRTASTPHGPVAAADDTYAQASACPARSGAGLNVDARHDEHDAAGRLDQALTYGVLLIPLLLGFLLAPRALGTSGLDGETVTDLLLGFGGGSPVERGISGEPPPPARPIEDVPGLLGYLHQVGDRGIGQRVRLVGMVARSESLGVDEIALVRYTIAHCVADARPLGLLVITPDVDHLATDQWVRIDGVLASRERQGERLVSIRAETVTPIEEPANPYLGPMQFRS
jgi:uncharacterized repeat protein (TIGR03943 family)